MSTQYRFGENKRVNITDLIPSHYKDTEVETFLEFFEDFLNEMYVNNNAEDILVADTTSSTSGDDTVYTYNFDSTGTLDSAYGINSVTPVSNPNVNNGQWVWQDLTPMLASTGNTVASITGTFRSGPSVITAARGTFSAVEINGEILIDNKSVLTFEDPNPDLKYAS